MTSIMHNFLLSIGLFQCNRGGLGITAKTPAFTFRCSYATNSRHDVDCSKALSRSKTFRGLGQQQHGQYSSRRNSLDENRLGVSRNKNLPLERGLHKPSSALYNDNENYIDANLDDDVDEVGNYSGKLQNALSDLLQTASLGVTDDSDDKYSGNFGSAMPHASNKEVVKIEQEIDGLNYEKSLNPLEGIEPSAPENEFVPSTNRLFDALREDGQSDAFAPQAPAIDDYYNTNEIGNNIINNNDVYDTETAAEEIHRQIFESETGFVEQSPEFKATLLPQSSTPELVRKARQLRRSKHTDNEDYIKTKLEKEMDEWMSEVINQRSPEEDSKLEKKYQETLSIIRDGTLSPKTSRFSMRSFDDYDELGSALSAPPGATRLGNRRNQQKQTKQPQKRDSGRNQQQINNESQKKHDMNPRAKGKATNPLLNTTAADNVSSNNQKQLDQPELDKAPMKHQPQQQLSKLEQEVQYYKQQAKQNAKELDSLKSTVSQLLQQQSQQPQQQQSNQQQQPKQLDDSTSSANYYSGTENSKNNQGTIEQQVKEQQQQPKQPQLERNAFNNNDNNSGHGLSTHEQRRQSLPSPQQSQQKTGKKIFNRQPSNNTEPRLSSLKQRQKMSTQEQAKIKLQQNPPPIPSNKQPYKTEKQLSLQQQKNQSLQLQRQEAHPQQQVRHQQPPRKAPAVRDKQFFKKQLQEKLKEKQFQTLMKQQDQHRREHLRRQLQLQNEEEQGTADSTPTQNDDIAVHDLSPLSSALQQEKSLLSLSADKSTLSKVTITTPTSTSAASKDSLSTANQSRTNMSTPTQEDRQQTVSSADTTEWKQSIDPNTNCVSYQHASTGEVINEEDVPF